MLILGMELLKPLYLLAPPDYLLALVLILDFAREQKIQQPHSSCTSSVTS